MLIVEIQFHWKKEGGTVLEQRREWRKKEKKPSPFPSFSPDSNSGRKNKSPLGNPLPSSSLFLSPCACACDSPHLHTESAPKKESLSRSLGFAPPSGEGGSAIKDCCCVPIAQPQIRDQQESVTFVDAVLNLVGSASEMIKRMLECSHAA